MPEHYVLNSGDTAWVLICGALVLFMTPGLALFYGGQVSGRNVLSMLQQNFIPIGVVTITWLFLGYSIALGANDIAGLFGDIGLFALDGTPTPEAPPYHVVGNAVTIPTLAFVLFQMMFAIITPALATGAVADRMKILGWTVLVGFWSIFVYPPIAHSLWHPRGWLANLGAQDWAGGLVVHATAGAAALALLAVVGRRKGWPGTGTAPNSLPLVIVGGGILWFGWFGFNGGGGLQANALAAQAVFNTQVAASAGLMTWLVMERLMDGHATVLGAVSGSVAGLATVTPCAGYVNALSALAIGGIAGVVCHLALRVKYRFRFDDALDVVAVHFFGGVTGIFLLGFFGDRAINPQGRDGVFFGGGFGLLGSQIIAAAAVSLFAFVATWIIAAAVQGSIGLRVPTDEQGNLDRVQQGTVAYNIGTVGSLPGAGSPPAGTPPQHPAVEAPPAPAESAKLVTAFVRADLVHATDLERSLSAAGANTIVISEANVVAAEPESHVIRGYRLHRRFQSALRVEALVPDSKVREVLRLLDPISATRPGVLVQTAVSATGEPGPA